MNVALLLEENEVFYWYDFTIVFKNYWPISLSSSLASPTTSRETLPNDKDCYLIDRNTDHTIPTGIG